MAKLINPNSICVGKTSHEYSVPINQIHGSSKDFSFRLVFY